MIKNLLDGKHFYFQQKESYTFADVQNIIEQHNGFVIKETDSQVTEKISLLTKAQAEAEAKVKESADSLESYKTKLTDFETKVANLEGELAPIRAEQKNKSAKELLAGLVATGAEVDTYEKLASKIAEVQFEDGEELTSKQEKVKPLIDEFIKDRPYLQPIKVEVKNDDPKIVGFKKGEENKKPEYTGNVLRMNG